jgi:hypothetical protein
MNSALKILLKIRDEYKIELQKKVMLNMNELLMALMKKQT